MRQTESEPPAPTGLKTVVKTTKQKSSDKWCQSIRVLQAIHMVPFQEH